MNLGLRNKKAIVCGSTQGIGKAIAVGLAKQGVSLTLIARNESVLKEVVNTLDTSLAQNHNYLCVDFADNQFAKKIEILEKTNYDILINNTGGPASGPIADASAEDFLLAFKMHLLNNQILIQKVVGGMKKNSFGRIINIISTSVKAPIPGLGVSNTIRAAVANWAKTLSFEVGLDGVTVNNILPGFTNTQRLQNIFKNKAESSGDDIESIIVQAQSEIPVGRFADPSEVAKIIVFLCSKDAAYINGTSLPVDGGRLGSM
jgi:3-oxoacyl-[acyl-carrier protein] reductase